VLRVPATFTLGALLEALFGQFRSQSSRKFIRSILDTLAPIACTPVRGVTASAFCVSPK